MFIFFLLLLPSLFHMSFHFFFRSRWQVSWWPPLSWEVHLLQSARPRLWLLPLLRSCVLHRLHSLLSEGYQLQYNPWHLWCGLYFLWSLFVISLWFWSLLVWLFIIFLAELCSPVWELAAGHPRLNSNMYSYWVNTTGNICQVVEWLCGWVGLSAV